MFHIAQAIALLSAVTMCWPKQATAEEIWVMINGIRENIVDKGLVVPELVWSSRATALDDVVIPVCWLDSDPTFKRQRESVEDAVAKTWQASAKVAFSWGFCETGSEGVRIKVEDSNPHTIGIGTQTAYSDEAKAAGYGVLLNFTFRHWPYACRRVSGDTKIRDIAVHEFGHVLGFLHEHNRTDRPEWCKEAPAGSLPATSRAVTIWDGESEMNYCYCDDNYELSTLDTQSAQAVYGSR